MIIILKSLVWAYVYLRLLHLALTNKSSQTIIHNDQNKISKIL